MTAGRIWAYVGAVLGGSVSVAANVAHSFVPPAGAAPGWRPHAGAVAGAVFWPVALLVAIEIMARVAWPAGRRWVAVRFGGLLPVAVVTAVVSYRHMSGLLGFYREDPLTARIGPLAVDGLMVMAAGALLALGTRHGVSAGQGRDDTQDRSWAGSDGGLRPMHALPREGQPDRLRYDVGVRPGPALTGSPKPVHEPLDAPSTAQPEPVLDEPVDGPPAPSKPRPSARPRTRPADELGARRRASRKPSKAASRTASTRQPTGAERAVMDELGVSRSKAASILKQRRAEAEA